MKKKVNKASRSKATKKVAPEESKATVFTVLASEASTTSNVRTRRNASSTIERSDNYVNIENAFVPFKKVRNTSNMTASEAIELCQKAYYNFAVFRNTIDVMTEFSSSEIYFRGGNKKSRSFFSSWWKKICGWSIQDKFFREYYRSGNVVSLRIDGKISAEDISKITQVFGSNIRIIGNTIKLPLRYVILNPADLEVLGSASFVSPTYYKELTDYELQCLRHPKTEEDKEVFEALPPEVKKQIKSGESGTVLLPLNPDKISAVFYKKQDYEPFAVPMGFPVLADINWKAEMKKMDMSITRTFQQVILLITTGAGPKDGGINYKNLEALQSLFANESIGRVLVADYTTKAEFVVPKIADLLDPRKYELIDKDIKLGLNYILSGDNEKFANQSIRVKVFVERLKQAREAFINEFLLPEVKRIAQDLGFKNFPTPCFDDINLKDDAEWQRITSRLMEMGLLTPEEGFEAMETGRLPSAEDSLESQKVFKEHRDEGLYEPLVGGPASQMELTKESGKQQAVLQQKKLAQETGRPPGSKAPQTTKKVKPAKASEEITYSLTKVKDMMILSQQLEATVQKALKKHFKIKTLNAQQLKVAEQITHVIMANETPDNWEAKAADYAKNPVDANPEVVKEIQNIAYEFQADDYLATLLYHSKR